MQHEMAGTSMEAAHPETQPALRRLALVDLGEREASVLPALLARDDYGVQLVVAERAGEPWTDAMAQRGIPCTSDLAELTRHVFDAALVGEQSPRRERVEALVRAMGAAVMKAHDFGAPVSASRPDLRVITRPAPTPTPDDAAAVEQWLSNLATRSEASGARLIRNGSRPRIVAHVGDMDPLLDTLSELALQIGTPQIISRIEGGQPGRLSGSWPIATAFFTGALAASGLRGQAAQALWADAARDLTRACREKAGCCEPVGGDWHPPAEFLARVRVAIAQGGEDRHSLHRLQFEGPVSAIETFCGTIHSRLRESDALCRPAPDQVLLLCSGTPAEFIHVRRRLGDLWEEVCRAAGLPPTLLLSDERIEMSSPIGAALMFAAATGWTRPERTSGVRS